MTSSLLAAVLVAFVAIFDDDCCQRLCFWSCLHKRLRLLVLLLFCRQLSLLSLRLFSCSYCAALKLNAGDFLPPESLTLPAHTDKQNKNKIKRMLKSMLVFVCMCASSHLSEQRLIVIVIESGKGSSRNFERPKRAVPKRGDIKIKRMTRRRATPLSFTAP